MTLEMLFAAITLLKGCIVEDAGNRLYDEGVL